MTRRIAALLAPVASVVLVPSTAAAQNPVLTGSFRPYLHVLLAYAAAWVGVAAWAVLIAVRLRRLSRRVADGERRA